MSSNLFVDPPIDPDHPSRTVAWYPPSHGEQLLGVVHVPAGRGPHPGVLLLHGLPGTERNLDLAQALRRAGYVTAMCHYRGAWGTAGDYTISGVLEDCHALVEAFRREAPAAFGADPDRLALFGHSLGGFAALMTAAARSDVEVVATAAAADFGRLGLAARGDEQVAALIAAALDETTPPLAGATGESLLGEASDHGADWLLGSRADIVATKAVLLVAGAEDTDLPPEQHHAPMVAALEAAGATRLEHHVLPADHSFSACRIALAELVADFLDRYLR